MTIPIGGGGIILLIKNKKSAKKAGGKMQILKKNKRMLIGIIVGVLISSFVSYAIAETLINSKDVVYQDNSNLVADNVQDAIDGTCSKIDTRLSEIEDKLYTVKKIAGSKRFTTTTDYSNTGLEITFPANSYCSVTFWNAWQGTNPMGMTLSTGKTSLSNWFARTETNISGVHLFATYSDFSEVETTYYIYFKHLSAGQTDQTSYTGFCATKYK